MTDRDSSGAYRDDLAAAQARIAALEEKLATREDGERDDDPEHDDPETAQLVQQREDLARIVATGKPEARAKLFGAIFAVGCSIPWAILLRLILLDGLWPRYFLRPAGTLEELADQQAELARLHVGFPGVWWMWVAAAVVMAAAMYLWFLSKGRKANASNLQQLDARIAEARREQDERRDEARRKRDEARRLRTVERELVALREAREKPTASEGGAPRVRVEVEGDEIEEEAREALSLARRR